MSRPAYDKGLQEIGDGVHAYLQPDGTWGWSNAGLLAGDGSAALVDTLFDLGLTAQMLDAMEAITTTCPIATVVNTHANGDHCYGNQLVAGAGVEVVASRAASEEMDETPPAAMAALLAVADDLPDPLGPYLTRIFGPFDFDGIELVPPTRTFEGELALDVGGRRIELVEVGPAHTAGDVIAWLPDQRVLFAGDILFIGGTPVMWAGPTSGWIAACDRIIELDPAVIVPGHGPLTDLDGVRSLRGYLQFLDDATRTRWEAGMAPGDAIREISGELRGTEYESWTDGERLVINVHTAWATLDPSYTKPNVTTLFGAMAAYAAGR